MIDALTDRVRRLQVFLIELYKLHIRRTEVLYDTIAAYEQLLEEAAIRSAIVFLDWIRTKSNDALLRESATVYPAGFHISGADSKQIRDIIVVYERTPRVYRAVDNGKPIRINRGIAVIHRD